MKTTEKLSIEEMLDILTNYFGVHPNIPEDFFDYDFNCKNYKTIISKIKNRMGLNNKIKIICYESDVYPCNDNVKSPARILIPSNVPMIGTRMFKDTTITIEIKNRTRKNINIFTVSICHELSHLVLHGVNHELKLSEKATDLCVMIFGFSNFVEKSKDIPLINIGNMCFSISMGYLSKEEISTAIAYLKSKRQ